MSNIDESNAQQENDATQASNKKKKTVSWNDKQSEGKISAQHLSVGEAASPSKEALNEQMKQLVEKEGYSESEAAAFVGKPMTLSGEVLITDPFFYTSADDIKKQVADKREKIESSTDKQSTGTQNSFFKTIRIGMTEKELTEENLLSSPNRKGENAKQANEYNFFSSSGVTIGSTGTDAIIKMMLAQIK